ncbi:MAG: hypothetical protein NVS1B11_01280 [Terriglobales bacterium]
MNWKKIIARGIGGLALLLVAAVIVALMILRSQLFHRYVLAKIVQVASESTGGKVDVHDFNFHWSGLRVDLDGIIIHGTESADQKPLLQVDKLTVGLKVLSVLHQQVNLNELLIEHPVANLIVSKNGHNNIPQPNVPKQRDSQTNVFDLAVGHLLLSNGEIYYNNRKSVINADVLDLRAETNFSVLAKRYAGQISYHNGHVQSSNLKVLPHSFDLKFIATPSGLSLSPLLLTVGSSNISLQADVTDYGDPKVAGNYNLLIHTQDVAGLLSGASPSGDVTLSGAIQYQNLPNQALLRDVILNGVVSSNGLRVNSPQGDVYVKKLGGGYSLANGNFTVHNLVADLFDGRLSANASAQHLDTTPSSKIHLSLERISIAALKQSLKAPSTKQLPLSGTIQGDADASWIGNIQTIQVHSHLGVHAGILNTSSRTKPVPLIGVVHVNYDATRGIVTVLPSTLRTPATSIVAEGQISNHSNLTLVAKANDLHELNSLLAAFTSASQQKDKSAASLGNFSGSVTLSGKVTGSMQQPHLDAHLSAQNLQVGESFWRSLQLTAEASPTGISVRDGSLLSASQGQVTFRGNANLRDWSYLTSNPIAADISVRNLSIAELQQLANVKYPISGDLSADVALRGSQSDPAGHGSAQIANAVIYDEPVQHLGLQFEAANGSVNSSLKVKLPAGTAEGTLTFVPKTKAYKVRLDAPAIVLAKLHVIQTKIMQLSGTVNITASGAGTFDDPQLTASVQLPQLQVRQTTITGIKAQLVVENHKANFNLASDVAQASIRGRGTVDLNGSYYADAQIDTSKFVLDPLLAIYVPNRPNGFQGETELHATLKGPLKDKSRLEAHLEIPTLSASYQSAHFEASGPIRADYVNSVLVLRPSEITGTDTSLRFQGKIPFGVAGPMSLTAQGSVNLRLLSMLSPDVKSAGIIALDVRSNGSEQKPQVRGQIHIHDVSLATSSAPLGVDHLNGTLDIGNNQVQVTKLEGKVGGGDISAGGTITYLPQVQYNLALQSKSVRLRYPEGIRAMLDGNLTLNGTPQASSLAGRVLINSLLFTSDFDLANFMDQFTGASAPPSGETMADHVKLNIALQSSEDLAAATSEISVEGQANLRVIGTAADPVVVGRTDLTAGEIFFMKQRYQLERGIINFTNPNRTEPVVNMLITTTVQQYNLSLTIVGPIEKLRTSYVSDPPLPPVDIINLLAKGKTAEGATPANFGADSQLAQGIAGRLTNYGVQRLAGTSSLEIDPLIGGNNRNPSARIAVQRHITRKFLFTFSTDVTQPQGEIIQGEYQINKRWSVSAVRDESGGVAFDGRFHTTF